MGQHTVTHDPCDPSEIVTYLTHWPMTHWPIAFSALDACAVNSSTEGRASRRSSATQPPAFFNGEMIKRNPLPTRIHVRDYYRRRQRRGSRNNHRRLFPRLRSNRLPVVPRSTNFRFRPTWHLNIVIQWLYAQRPRKSENHIFINNYGIN